METCDAENTSTKLRLFGIFFYGTFVILHNQVKDLTKHNYCFFLYFWTEILLIKILIKY